MNDARVSGIELYIATGKQKHGEPETSSVIPPGDSAANSASAMEKMKQKLKTEKGQALYKMRKAIVEPVFGQIKAARGIDRKSTRLNSRHRSLSRMPSSA